MTARAMLKCTHCLMTRRCPVKRVSSSQFENTMIHRLAWVRTLRAINKLSPSTYAKLKFTQPG